MIETNCWMPEELYNDWLIERGYENGVNDFFDMFGLSAYVDIPVGDGGYNYFDNWNDTALGNSWRNGSGTIHPTGYYFGSDIAVGNGSMFHYRNS